MEGLGGASAALHELLEELNITSLDDSDLGAAAGFPEGYSVSDVCSATSGLRDFGAGFAGESFDEDTSSDSALEASVGRVFGSPHDDDDNDAVDQQELERHLRLSAFAFSGESLIPQVARVTASYIAAAQQVEQLQHVEELVSEVPRKEAANPAGRSTGFPPPPVAHHGCIQTTAAAGAGAWAAAPLRLHMYEFDISEAQYNALRALPEEELNLREWVQLRFHESKALHAAEAERRRLEIEALRENLFTAQTRAERAERQLQRQEATTTDLQRELDHQLVVAKTQREQSIAELKEREQEVIALTEKGQRFDAVFKDGERLREETTSLLQALANESSGSQILSKELAQTTERLQQLELDHRLLRKDADSHERRACSLEETLVRRDDEVAELRAKVESLREKKREIARRFASEQASLNQDAKEKIDKEIQRLREHADAELEVVRGNLNALHAKEVDMLRERIEASDGRCADLQRRLDDEEHAHQALLLSAGRVRAELQNEITELSGCLKLKAFESERAALTHEEVSLARQRANVEAEQLRRQVEVLKKEYYDLEAQLREGRAAERAELASLREQLKGYTDIERELDAAIRAYADGMGIGSEARSSSDLPHSMKEALILGTTLASVPTSSQRRIQQSILLAHELQRRSAELAKAQSECKQLRCETDRLCTELEVVRKELQYSSEPQSYLLEALRQKEREVLDLRRHTRSTDAELERCREQLESAVNGRLQVEEDLHKLLAQRQHLDGLCKLLSTAAVAGGDGGGTPIVSQCCSAAKDGSGAADFWNAGNLPRAEHRGRAPTQQQHQQAGARSVGNSFGGAIVGGGGQVGLIAPPAWFQRLRAKLDSTQESG